MENKQKTSNKQLTSACADAPRAGKQIGAQNLLAHRVHGDPQTMVGITWSRIFLRGSSIVVPTYQTFQQIGLKVRVAGAASYENRLRFKYDIDSEELIDKLGMKESLDRMAKASSMRWHGHVLRKEDENVIVKALKFEVSGSRGRPKQT